MDLEEKEQDIDYSCDEIREDNYLDPLYGDESKLSYEDWQARSRDKPEIAKVFYEAQNLRSLVFLKSGVEFPEKADFTKFCEANKVHLGN